MDEDFDQTVIRPVRRLESGNSILDDDTILRGRPLVAAPAPHYEDAPETASTCYRFVVNVHDPIGLDRPAYIGRRPSAPRITHGGRPRLVRVPSPRGEVSGTHVELRQQGAMVIVTDLKSTNGTTVSVAGSTPVRLRQGESVVVFPGSIIEIGDTNVIEILPIERPALPDAAKEADAAIQADAVIQEGLL